MPKSVAVAVVVVVVVVVAEMADRLIFESTAAARSFDSRVQQLLA